jgi:tetratricopeptide (TPR) repeat protein
MKRIFTVFGIGLLLSGFVVAQTSATPPAGGNQQQSKPGNALPGNQPANNQTAPAQGSTPAANPNAPPVHSKAQPQAKTQEEFNAYQTAISTADPTAADTAANDFAKKFPDSELLVALYSGLMQKFQNINNADKVLEMGHKVLKIDPDYIPALALISYVISESTRETDLDRDQKYAEGLKNAQQVVKTMDTALVVPPTVTPEQLANLKGFLLSMANSSMGYIELNQKNYPASETHFKAAIDAYKGPDVDPIAYLRLAIAQDNQKKYSEAIANADKAVQTAQAQKNDQVANMAKNEKDRLTQLTAGSDQAPNTSVPAPKQ